MITKLICRFWLNPMQLAFLMSLTLLLGAYSFQYIGGMTPCDLCWPQRYAHFSILAITTLGLLLHKAGRKVQMIFTSLTLLAIGYSVAMSGYHTGVEQKWWQGPTTCTGNGEQSADLDNLFDNMMSANLVRCDEIPWEMFGISMAGYNFIISVLVFGFVACALISGLRKREAS